MSRLLPGLRRLWRSARGRTALRVWYDPSFRLPIPSLGARHGVEPRRADFVVWYLTIDGWIHLEDVQTPRPIRYADLARVHTEELLTSLVDGTGLVEVFHADPTELQVDEVMFAVRLACGATLEAARHALRARQPSLSLLGGFHHAFPDKAGGLCPVNDIAVAVAALRAEGFTGAVAVLDLDAHPPDGTAACLRGDSACWIGSISGSDWGPLEGVDETVLPAGSSDAAYLEALDALLDRMPPCDLAFVLAGGDVLDGDRMGKLAVSLDGVRRRDITVCRALRGVGSVWMPGGGYTDQAWRVLAGTALALLGQDRRPIQDLNPLDLRYQRVASHLDPGALTGSDDDWLDARELEEELGLRRPGAGRLLGHYTREGVLHALDAYGILQHLERLGYARFRVEIEAAATGQRVRLHGRDDADEEHMLVEAVLERKTLAGQPLIFIHWLTLRHPAGTFGSARPALPGQEVPGLGLSLEAVEILERAAARIGADGVAYRPSFLHTAWTPGGEARFVDDRAQGRLEALVRDLGHLGRFELSTAVAEGRVRMNGEPYTWEPEPMVLWLDGPPAPSDDLRAERERVRFTIDA